MSYIIEITIVFLCSEREDMVVSTVSKSVLYSSKKALDWRYNNA